MGSESFPCKIPLWPCVSNYDLHEMAGGSPLRFITAPNIHRTSQRRREVCKQNRKTCVPIKKCGSKRTHHAPSRRFYHSSSSLYKRSMIKSLTASSSDASSMAHRIDSPSSSTDFNMLTS